MDHRTFFSDTDRAEIEKAVTAAESRTSGEVRVHIEKTCHDALERARIVFDYLRMHKTEQRNGVLFYLAVESKAFAILGDQGIDARVPKTFWDSTKDAMAAEFAQGRFKEGLCKGIDEAGKQLAAFFPRREDDKNELVNTISFGER